MSDQDKFRRMLDMLMLLSQTYGENVDNLAERYQVSRRSIYRYIKTFKNVGFVVKKSGNHFKVESLETPYNDISDLIYFSREDSYLLSETIHQLSDHSEKHRLLADKLAAIYDSGMVAAQLVPKREVSKVKDLIAAVEEGVQVTLRNYRFGGGEEGTDVHAEPFGFSNDFKGVWAYDIARQQNDFFYMGRIGKVDLKATPWQYADYHDRGQVDIFGSIGYGNHRKVKMELDRVAYGKLRSMYPRAQDYITRIYSERYKFEGPVINYSGIGEFVLSVPDHVKVIAPGTFKEYLKEKADKIMRY